MIGKLRRRYSVRGRTGARNVLGERDDAYTHKFFIWGEAPREGTGNIRSEAGALRTEDTLRLRTRFRTDIDIGDQLADGSLLYFVRSVLDVDGRRHYLQLVASLTPGGI